MAAAEDRQKDVIYYLLLADDNLRQLVQEGPPLRRKAFDGLDINILILGRRVSGRLSRRNVHKVDCTIWPSSARPLEVRRRPVARFVAIMHRAFCSGAGSHNRL